MGPYYLICTHFVNYFNYSAFSSFYFLKQLTGPILLSRLSCTLASFQGVETTLGTYGSRDRTDVLFKGQATFVELTNSSAFPIFSCINASMCRLAAKLPKLFTFTTDSAVIQHTNCKVTHNNNLTLIGVDEMNV